MFRCCRGPISPEVVRNGLLPLLRFMVRSSILFQIFKLPSGEFRHVTIWEESSTTKTSICCDRMGSATYGFDVDLVSPSEGSHFGREDFKYPVIWPEIRVILLKCVLSRCSDFKCFRVPSSPGMIRNGLLTLLCLWCEALSFFKFSSRRFVEFRNVIVWKELNLSFCQFSQPRHQSVAVAQARQPMVFDVDLVFPKRGLPIRPAEI